MKRVLFCLQTMVRGGVEKELITVLKMLPPNQVQATIILAYIDDLEIMEEIPNWVKVINLNIDQSYYLGSSTEVIKAKMKRGEMLEAGKLLCMRVLNVGMTHSNQSFNKIPRINERYDLAICYHIHSPFMLRYVAEKTEAYKKIGWIHNDFKTSNYPIKRLKRILSFYSEFVAVSNKVKEEFIGLCPEYANRVSVIHNIVDEIEIREKAKDIPENDLFFSDDRVRVLTVGRFTSQKGIDQAIEVCRRLKGKDISFCWYLIGWGEEEEKYRELITMYSLEDEITILGKKDNPYPYIAECDIYVQPSRHEAWGLVVQEARALNKPIVCTAFAGSDEQIRHNETGYIVPLGNVDELTLTVERLITDKNDRIRLSNNLKQEKNNQNDSWIVIEKLQAI